MRPARRRFVTRARAGSRTGTDGTTRASLFEEYSRRKPALRVQGSLDGANVLDPVSSVELDEQLLLDRVPADAVLRERRTAQPDDLASERDNRRLPRLDIVERSRNDVRVEV